MPTRVTNQTDKDAASETSSADRPAWHCLSVEDACGRLSSAPSGLASSTAAERRMANGPNELKEGKRISPFRIFVGQFNSLMVWILIAAGIIVGVLGEAIESLAVLIIVVLNAAIGFYQEFHAEKSIAALKLMTAPKAKVLRDGHIVSVQAADIVEGDVLDLEAGDLVAADARVLSASSLRCIESALTGESEAVEKSAITLDRSDVPLGDRSNMLFMGTSVAAGTGKAVVVATGMNTELGRIAELMENSTATEETPLQQKLGSLGRMLVWAALGIVALLFCLGLLRGVPLLELTMTSVSLAVAAVPEGLPAVVTVSLALGVRRMSRRNALVRRLAAVETLGSTTVICTDKTGTLTMGEMTVRALYVGEKTYEVTGEGYAPEGEIRFEGMKADDSHSVMLKELGNLLVGCNNAHVTQVDSRWTLLGDPTEGAMVAAAAKIGCTRDHVEAAFPKVHEIPFDSDRKLSAVIRRLPNGQLRAFINGAPDVLLDRCVSILGSDGVIPLSPEMRRHIAVHIADVSAKAMRVLGSAYHDLESSASADFTPERVERELVFVGLTGMHDPPRPEAQLAISRCQSAGIRVVMITGDHPQTAAAIAGELGIVSESAAITGVEINGLNDSELQQRAIDTAVYARVTAEHKLRIVRALKASGAVVAMTGDGVNDAPAIKGADIGIAMGKSGTEVTRQAADMIITDDNFATIVAAVEEGRGIYDNIRKTLQYLLAGSTGELLLMTICVVVGLPSPLLPIHLLWINLVTDGLPALCLATDRIDADVMNRRPRSRAESITDHGFLRTMIVTGSLTAAITFLVFFVMLRTATTDQARSYAFATLVFAELLRAFGARSETKPVWKMSLWTNRNLLLVIAVSFLLQIASQQNPMLGRLLRTSSIPLTDCLLLLAIATLPMFVLEIIKVMTRVRLTHGDPLD